MIAHITVPKRVSCKVLTPQINLHQKYSSIACLKADSQHAGQAKSENTTWANMLDNVVSKLTTVKIHLNNNCVPQGMLWALFF